MLKTVLKAIEWTLFGIIMCLCGLLWLVNYNNTFPIKAYTVLTGSMEPAIPVGSMVFARDIKVSELNIGDIITFSSPSDPKKVIVHRIFSVKDNDTFRTFTTKGDNNDGIDNWIVDESLVKGHAVLYFPTLGYLSGYSKTPAGFAVIMGTPALLVMLIYIRHIILGIKEYADNKAKKAVEDYIRSQQNNPLKLVNIFVMMIVMILSISSTAYATFTSSVQLNNIAFQTAENFQTTEPSVSPSASPNSSATPTVSPSAAASLFQGYYAQCRNNKWKTYTNPTFKNIGQCISYFVRLQNPRPSFSPRPILIPTMPPMPTIPPISQKTAKPTGTSNPLHNSSL